MSDLFQSGNSTPGLPSEGELLDRQHPDADQLNAFVEHTLPEHERQEMLTHLAECLDCRDIVGLSIVPAEETFAPETEPISKPGMTAWFASWKLAWIAVPALAALVLLTVHLKNLPSGKGRAVTSVQVSDSRPAKPSAKTTGEVKAPGILYKRRFSRSKTAANNEEEPSVDNVDTSTSSTPAASDGLNVLALSPATDAKQPTEGQAAAQHNMSSSGGPGLQRPSIGGALMPAPAPSSLAANRPAAGSPPSATAKNPIANDFDVSAGVVASAQNSIMPAASPTGASRSSAAFAMRSSRGSSRPSPLPSGLDVLSLATNLHQRLAIDTNNNVFFSEDEGQQWKVIAPVWKSRPVAATTASTTITSIRAKALTLAVPERFTVGAPASVQVGDQGSSLGGVITDATGAVIPGATVTATDTHTALVRTVEADTKGHYLVQELPPGVYRLEARAPGFLKQSQTAALAPSQQAITNIALAVASSSETVTVAASQPVPLETFSRPAPIVGLKAKKSALPAPSNVPPPVFVILTDTGDRWTSPDGVTWKPE